MVTTSFEDFYEVPILNFDILKLREDLDDESTNLMPKEVIYADDVDIITKDDKVRDELVIDKYQLLE